MSYFRNHSEIIEEYEEFNDLICQGIFKSDLFKYGDLNKLIDDNIRDNKNLSLDKIINSDLIPFFIRNFFNIYQKITHNEKQNIIENISKFFMKIKRVYVINLILAYTQFIETLVNKIKNDLSEEKSHIEFDEFNDINYKCLVEVNLNINEDIKLCDFYDNYVKIDLKFFNETKSKNIYLSNILSKVFFMYKSDNNDSIFHNYKLNTDLMTVTITQNSFYLKLKEINIKEVYGRYFDKIKKDILIFLENEIINQIRMTKRNTSNFSKSFEKLINLLKITINNYDEKISKILPFGSVTQFTYNILSDLEVCIFTKKEFRKKQKEIIDEVLKILKENYEDVEIRHTKRTKLINFRDDKLNIKIDLLLNNEFGIINSDLIKNYCLFDSRCMILINLIKDWSKFHEINGNYNGFLSSYCYSLMVIYFLQKINPPILPVFHTNEFNKFQELETCYDESHYFINTEFEKTKNNFINENKSSVAELLFRFFIFYFHLFNHMDYSIDISNKSATYRFNEISYLNRNHDGRKGLIVYCFIDPIDYSYNPGSFFIKNSTQDQKFKEEMERAIKNILLKKSIFN